MSTIPEWPPAPGPRVLTLVGNDLTIDVRARKTASSLARAGYSVISIGVDASGAQPSREAIDGAVIIRVTPTPNPRVSPRRLRTSRAELRELLWYRLELRRQRLQLRRRNTTARRYLTTREDPPWVRLAGSAFSSILRLFVSDSDERDRLKAGLDRRMRAVDRKLRFGPGKASLVLDQKLTGLTQLAYRWAARPTSTSDAKGHWRRDLPELHRYEAAIGGIVDALEPDLIHVHDVFHIGLAVRAKSRAAADDRDIHVVYDAHEYVPGLPLDARRRSAYAELESEYIGEVDAVVTVAPEMAEAITRRHGVGTTVVLNAPDMDTAVDVEPARHSCGIPDGARVVTYVGGIAPHRGAELMLEAVSRLEGVHLMMIVGPETAYVKSLVESGERRGLAGRVHVAPFVSPEGVVSYLRGTDVTLIPLSREVENYEVTLPNKLFQSIQAGVPVVVSDSPAMAAFVRQHGVGEIFSGGDVDSLTSAIERVLGDVAGYQESLSDSDLLKETTWAAQAEILIEVYSRLGVGLT